MRSSILRSSCTLRFGLAGWHFPHWDRIFLPVHKPRGFHPLRYLSSYFDVLEIQSSFHQPVRPEIARLWLRETAANPRFRFTAKLWRRFTHDRVLLNEDMERFHEGLRPLAESGKLGCLLLEFPWSFRFTKENREFLIRLRRAFHVYPLVAEMRHASWSCQEALGTLVDYHVGFANADLPAAASAMPPSRYLTSSIGYVRLHGRNPRDWWSDAGRPGERSLHGDYLYSLPELVEWKERVESLRSFAGEAYVVFTNDVKAQSAVNALQLRALVEGVCLDAPEPLHKLYGPELQAFVEPPRQALLPLALPAAPAPVPPPRARAEQRAVA